MNEQERCPKCGAILGRREQQTRDFEKTYRPATPVQIERHSHLVSLVKKLLLTR